MTLEENLRRIDELALVGQDVSDYLYEDEIVYTRCNNEILLRNYRKPKIDFYKIVEQSKELLPKLYCQPKIIELLNGGINLIYTKQTYHEVEYSFGKVFTNQKLFIEISIPYIAKITFDSEETQKNREETIWCGSLEKEMEIPLHEINEINTVIKNLMG